MSGRKAALAALATTIATTTNGPARTTRSSASSTGSAATRTWSPAAVTAIPHTSDPNARVVEADTSAYNDWLLLYTYSGSSPGNYAYSVTVKCPPAS